MSLIQIVKVTKVFTFEMAHALLGYDGACRNIHGHSYSLHVTVVGRPQQNPGHPKDGMVVDFKDLKALVKDKIIRPYDHALVLNDKTPEELVLSLKKGYEKILLFPCQPTAENLLLSFVHDLQSDLPEGVQLHQLRLYETASCYAEWDINLVHDFKDSS